MMQHDEEKLPQWAQDRIRELRNALRKSIDERVQVQEAHAVLAGRNWFTLPGPSFYDTEESRSLWLLDRNQPFEVCALGPGDVLLVGRKS
jgi:hypothetical protein